MTDNFRGDNANLIASINALLELDAEGALVPHGIGGHARALLSAAASRLSASIADTAGAKRLETTSENIARDIREGRFPQRSEPQMIAATPAPSVADAPRRFTGEQIAALRVAADALVERYAEPIRAILRDAEVADAAGASERDSRIATVTKDLIECLMLWNGQASAGLDVNALAGLRDELNAIAKESGND